MITRIAHILLTGLILLARLVWRLFDSPIGGLFLVLGWLGWRMYLTLGRVDPSPVTWQQVGLGFCLFLIVAGVGINAGRHWMKRHVEAARAAEEVMRVRLDELQSIAHELAGDIVSAGPDVARHSLVMLQDFMSRQDEAEEPA
ncbi:hypothetical protein [Burkholderia gladioli]|uniref:hypothetical protein n=1 Tax=Burkholderia gladioli TaxID=28095 RepID=UPI001642094B|nr:hypothetical protein [Burkholderia gladioli]